MVSSGSSFFVATDALKQKISYFGHGKQYQGKTLYLDVLNDEEFKDTRQALKDLGQNLKRFNEKIQKNKKVKKWADWFNE